MLQRGFYYAAGTVMICAIGAASTQLAMQILSFSSPLLNAAAALAGVAVVGNSLRRRMRAAAKRPPARSTRTLPGDVPAITARPEIREAVQRRAKVVARPVRCQPAPRRKTVGGQLPARRAGRDPASGGVGAGTIVRSGKEDVLADRQLVGSGRHAA